MKNRNKKTLAILIKIVLFQVTSNCNYKMKGETTFVQWKETAVGPLADCVWHTKETPIGVLWDSSGRGRTDD